ncbi:MAG: 8-oxo-dGTP diphosphatase MutT [Bacteroidales bacterium]|nr:8-oxo-dGTP diphosphatase MutT [Bacteroidales bacterium]
MTEVTCAIIIQKERVLVTQRSEQMPHALKWEFPGGKVKKGETPESCIRREIREELGIEIEVDQLLPSVRHAYDTHSIKLIPFICKKMKGEITLSEHNSYRWVPIIELEEMDWLDADVEVVNALKSKLTGGFS